jgi:hypothetical protein
MRIILARWKAQDMGCKIEDLAEQKKQVQVLLMGAINLRG